jgi:7-dehydrocholesterol reductase
MGKSTLGKNKSIQQESVAELSTPKRTRRKLASKSKSPAAATKRENEIRSKKNVVSDVWAPQYNDYSLTEWAIRTYVGPVLLIVICPLFVNLAALAMAKADGSIVDLLTSNTYSWKKLLIEAFPLPTFRVVKALTLFTLFQFLLLRFIPGPIYLGPISPEGEQPRHTRNGDKSFVCTFAVMYLLVRMELLDPCIVYDELVPIMTCLNLSAIVLSVFLLIKGIYFPSTKDHGSNYPWIFRYYEGEELYPAIFGVDLKNFVICRIGMMGWGIFTLSCVAASYREHGNTFTYPLLASAILNFLYVVKFFFLYEEGYMSAGDIAVDR